MTRETVQKVVNALPVLAVLVSGLVAMNLAVVTAKEAGLPRSWWANDYCAGALSCPGFPIAGLLAAVVWVGLAALALYWLPRRGYDVQ